ncbi:MAG: hypothetical protein ABIA37_04870 [Candidatus Woesearchaeota archaeon]
MSLEKQIEETRVGKMTTAVLKEVVREYIQDNTVKGRYKGNLYYLDLYRELDNFLKEE